MVKISDITEGGLSWPEYLELVEETGRIVVAGKGSLSKEVIPTLEKFRLNPDEWVATTKDFKKMFRRLVGPAELLRKAAKKKEKNWFHGMQSARRIFQVEKGN